mgnify:CR=1 FL=1
MRYLIFTISVLLISGLSSCQKESLKNKAIADRVILIGFDGLSPHGLQNASTPNLDALIEVGASSMKARGVMPTSSGANWGSMLLGAGPEQHGITTNGWRVDEYEFEATHRDEDGFFPSMFDAVRQKYPKSKIGVFHEWGTINRLFNPKAVDTMIQTKKVEESLPKALDFIKASSPKLVFVHLDAIDHAGHTYGHGTPEYFAEIAHIDSAVGTFITELKEAGLYESSHIVLSSDHGGKGKGHGGNSLEELLIPWIILGPGIKENTTLATNINTYDTPATIVRILGADIPDAWIGKPVVEAFASKKTKS